MLNKSKLKFQLAHIGQLGKGKLFGEKDAVLERPYSFTVKCHSSTGILFHIKTDKLISTLEEISPEILEAMKQDAKGENHSLNRYLETNKEFEDSSLFVSKYKNQMGKLEEMQ